MLQSVRRITKSVQLPVSADMEAGYACTPQGVADTVKGVIAAGAVGINLEDSPGDAGNPLVDPALHADKICVARAATDASGMPFVINARTRVAHSSACTSTITKPPPNRGRLARASSSAITAPQTPRWRPPASGDSAVPPLTGTRRAALLGTCVRACARRYTPSVEI